jgi:hypothetical protein
MKLRLMLIGLAGIGLSSPAFGEDQPKLQTLLIRRAFISPGAFVEYSGGKLMEFPPTEDGERRYDLRKWAEHLGQEMHPSLSVIGMEKAEVVVVRGIREDVDLIGRMLEPLCCFGVSVQTIQIGTRWWEYEDEPGLEVHKMPQTLEDLRARGGNTVRLLDVINVNTTSGERAVVENKDWPVVHVGKNGKNGAKQKNKESRWDGARESALEIEAIVIQGEMHFQMAYRARLGRAEDRPDLTIQVTKEGSLKDGTERIVHVQTSKEKTAGGKVKYHALSVGTQSLDERARTREEQRRDFEAENAELIRRAQKGIIEEGK